MIGCTMIEAWGYDLPLAVPYRWAKGTQHRRAGAIVAIRMGAAEGFGEVAPPPHEAVDGAALARRAVALVDGLDPSADGFLAALDARDPHPRLRCGISTAWHAAHAARRSVSLCALLSPDAPPAAAVPVNGLVTDADPEAAARMAVALARAGMNVLKVKCTADLAENRARIAAIRAAVPDAVLRLDPNESLTDAAAPAHLDELARHGIAYCEQPTPTHDPAGMAALRQATVIPIAADEATTDLAAARALIAADAVDVLILKPQRLGGPDRLLAVAREAHAAGIAVTVTNSVETAVGLTAALHMAACLAPPVPACGLGTARFLAEDLAEPPAIEGGAMRVPTAPGLGVTPRWPRPSPR